MCKPTIYPLYTVQVSNRVKVDYTRFKGQVQRFHLPVLHVTSSCIHPSCTH